MKPNIEDLNKTIENVPLTWLEETASNLDSSSTQIIEISVLVVIGIVIWMVNRFSKLGAIDLALLIFSVLALTLYPLYALYLNNSVLEAFLYAAGAVAVVNALRFASKKGTGGQ